MANLRAIFSARPAPPPHRPPLRALPGPVAPDAATPGKWTVRPPHQIEAAPSPEVPSPDAAEQAEPEQPASDAAAPAADEPDRAESVPWVEPFAEDAPDDPVPVAAPDRVDEAEPVPIESAEIESTETVTAVEAEPTPEPEAAESSEAEPVPPPHTVEAMPRFLAELEALLFVAAEPTAPSDLARALDRKPEEIDAALTQLGEFYQRQGRGLRVQLFNGKVQLVTAPAVAPYIERFLDLDNTARLSGPALETLAVVAYRQPVTRAQVESVRGVDCAGVLRSLLQRNLITEVGRVDAPGRPILYGVTEHFMQHFGLTALEELPPLEEDDADRLWAATLLAEEEGDAEDGAPDPDVEPQMDERDG